MLQDHPIIARTFLHYGIFCTAYKYLDNLGDDSKDSVRTREQIRKQKLWCENNKISHVIRTEKEIHIGEYTISNCAFMASRIRRWMPPRDVDSFKNILSGYLDACGSIDIETLIDSGRLPLGDELNFLCFMHYKGIIQIMIDGRPIDKRSEVVLYGIKKA